MQELFWTSNPMANRSKGNLAVNIGEDLLERVNTLAYLGNKSQAQLVREILEEKTKTKEKEIAAILKVRRKFSTQC